MATQREGKISLLLFAGEDTSWTDCYGECPMAAPDILVWNEDGRLHILPPSWSRGQAPATIGHLFLAGITFEVLRSGRDIELNTSPVRMDDVVRILRAAGADVTVLVDSQLDADDMITRLGGRWRQQ